MKKTILVTLLLLVSASAEASTLHMSGFQMKDGAITVNYEGNIVDPYFATKALLLAEDSGLHMAAPARRWIRWLLVRQRENGLFNRYRRADESAPWEPYTRTDADDSTLALWLELLYRNGRMSALEKKSAELAGNELEKLRDPASGIYYISGERPVGLFMDNVEIYGAFRAISRRLAQSGQHKEAKQYAAMAATLKKNIQMVFWSDSQQKFLVSTQIRTNEESERFYPNKVAQLFPLLYAHAGKPAEATYKTWIANNRTSWLDMPRTDYPWGLIALIALHMGDRGSAFCWQAKSEPFRYSNHWNVLEEVSLQIVKTKLSVNPPHVKIACVGVMT